MTKEELAKKLDNIAISNDFLLRDREDAPANNLVIAYGASDDLIELAGAINDEGYLCDSDGEIFEIRIDSKGFLTSFEQLLDNDANEEEFEEYFARKSKAKLIKAIWRENGKYTWSYETEIPHATFNILYPSNEGIDQYYCRGIVFSLDDLE